MVQQIKAILFDIGGTLVTKSNHGYRDLALIDEIARLLGEDCPPQELVDKIRSGEAGYKAWRRRSLVELSLEERWIKYILPSYPQDFIRDHAIRLQQLWSESRGKKWIEVETIQVLRELSSRGYILGTVSHTSPRILKEAGIDGLFRTSIHAVSYGRRKPHPSIFLAGARECGVSPCDCAYIGDRPSRDVIGPREAGIGQVILLQKEDTISETEPCPMKADLIVRNIQDLLNLFTGIANSPEPGLCEPENLYDAALSTMWWNKNTESADEFFLKGRKLGFARFELNHQVSPEEFGAIDLERFHIGSLHDPCPTCIPVKQLEHEDIQVTSLDEKLRRQGIDVVKRTIEQAYHLGANMVVVHLGRIAGDHSMDGTLREWFRSGLKDSQAYEDLRLKLTADRLERGKPHFEQLMKSLRSIVAFTEDTGLSLGFENRFYYYELPVFEEMEVIMAEFQQPWVGWQYDVGHLQVHQALGLMSIHKWLGGFASRITGVHLHDVRGIADHQPPGTGEVDFHLVAANLPKNAYRTFEISPVARIEQMKTSLELLEEIGCIINL